MDNYRGENTLAFFRKLFTTLLYEKLDELAIIIVPLKQSGFISGRKIHGAIVALSAIMQKARIFTGVYLFRSLASRKLRR